MSFEVVAQSVLEQHGYKRRTPDELVQWWANLVEQCVDGYDWTIYEFDDEMSVRDYIEAILCDSAGKNFDEYEQFKQKIDRLDEQYRSILQPEVKRPSNTDYWWRTGVLKYAGEEYCSDIESRYSIAVEVYDEQRNQRGQDSLF